MAFYLAAYDKSLLVPIEKLIGKKLTWEDEPFEIK